MKRYRAYNTRTGESVYLGRLTRQDLQPFFLRYKREAGVANLHNRKEVTYGQLTESRNQYGGKKKQ